MGKVVYRKMFIFLIMFISFTLSYEMDIVYGDTYYYYLTDNGVSSTGDFRNDGYAILDGDFVTNNSGGKNNEIVHCKPDPISENDLTWLRIYRSTGVIERKLGDGTYSSICDLKEGVNYHITVVYYLGDGLVLPNFDLYINGYKLDNFKENYLKVGTVFNRFNAKIFDNFTYVRDSSIPFSANEYSATLSKLDNNDNSISLSVAENGYDDHKLTVFAEMTLADLQAKITDTYSELKHFRNDIEVSDIIQAGDVIRVTSPNGMVVNDYAVETGEPRQETNKVSLEVSDGRVNALAYSETDNLSLYIASYKDDELIELKSAVPILSDDLYRYETDSIVMDDVEIKTFLWTSDLIPVDNKKMP